MKRLVTLASGQFGDMRLEDLCALAQEMGYEGLELATHAHFEVDKAINDPSYISYVRKILQQHNLRCEAISAHLVGQCVCDVWDERLDGFAPASLAGQPKAIRAWAIEEMKRTAKAAQAFGVSVVNGFTGSPIWSRWYSYPQTSEEMIDAGFALVKELWSPIFDVFDECKVKFALEVHPTEIAFDWYTTQRVFELFDWRETLGLNFDPSHLKWQGIDEVGFVRDFGSRIYHVHMKDVKMNSNPRGGILGSFLPFGDTRRSWDFVSVGHGNVDFDGIIRELNRIEYVGPLSVEWEDSGMDRVFGAAESCAYVKKINFSLPSVAFDAALKNQS